MAIRIPTSDQSKIYYGTQEIGAVYVGANKVWPDSSVNPNAFIMRVTVGARQTITIPFFNTAGYDGVIDWKDGSMSTITAYDDADRVHLYADAGDYDIEFTGTFPGLYFNNTGSKAIVKGIIQWGSVGMTSLTRAFYGCTSMSLLPNDVCAPATLTSIGLYAFRQCAFQNIVVPSNITTFGLGAFYQCAAMTSISLSSSITDMNTYTFYGCTSLLSINIPSSVTVIGEQVFRGCRALQSISLPSILTIASYAFYQCIGLTTITLPSCLITIASSAFSACSNILEYIVNPTSPPTCSSNSFYGINESCLIKVPSGSVNTYKITAGWLFYETKIVSQ
jgi:hypothetical protein